MQILKRCQRCGGRKFLVSRRTFKSANVGLMRSQNEYCGKCFRELERILASL